MSDALTLKKNSFIAIYRTGGWASCTWKVLPNHVTKDQADLNVVELERMGYRAFARTVYEHEIVGLPIGWHHSIVDFGLDTVSTGFGQTYHTPHPSRRDEVEAILRNDGLI